MFKPLTVIAIAALSITAVHAADSTAGKQKAAVCFACHGEQGKAIMPTYPNLAGQHEAYLVDALKEYRDGGRNNPIMVPMAKALTDTDMQNIAAYFAQFK